MTGSWPLIIALWGAGLGAAMQYAKIAVIFDLLDGIYPGAGPVLGWLVSVLGFIGILLGAVAAMLVSKVRYRRSLLGALWLGAAVSLGQALLPPLPVMLALRLVEGVSHLALVVAAPTLIAQIATDNQRGLALTLWGTFFGVAFALMVWLGRPIAIGAGIPVLFALHAAYMAGFALYLSPRLRRLPDTGEVMEISLRTILAIHVTIYRSAYISAPAVGWLFYTFCFVSILTVLPPFLDPSHRGLVIGSMPLVSIAVSMTFGVVMLRIMAAVRVVMIGFALSALCMIWLFVVPAGVLACLTLAGALGLIQGASFAAVPELNATAETRSQANGAMAQMGNLGNTLGTPVMAMSLAGWGYASLPVIAGFAFLLGLVMHILLTVLRRNA
ncbi:MFS transporter [Sulfitobacter guttiformis]|uniref:Putative MFS family arabinose efflux permease n=1 Tax=Sulfitobacter guttiformis TaxID=74349 RepID=A0A420DIN1_9RHOB|nr:MFS transporter [Sulfitobacter guttiformis]KIN72135.1 Major facilitator superfamily protein [Sulfitobacter guttiformis KCTC 32187]RKE94090.1 putative MFS family arabinose efflux permease [Sulfitobacter guttiformis]